MSDYYIRLRVNDWRDTSLDEEVREKIIRDIIWEACYNIEERATQEHDIVIKAERVDPCDFL